MIAPLLHAVEKNNGRGRNKNAFDMPTDTDGTSPSLSLSFVCRVFYYIIDTVPVLFFAFRRWQFVKGNICSSDLMMYVLREEKIDTILHFAAQTHVDNSFGNSFQFTQNNIYGTHVLLESAKKVIKRTSLWC